MRRSYWLLLFFLVCIGWKGQGLAGNVPGLLSVRQASEWILEEEKVGQVVFRSADTSLKLIPLSDGAVRVIRSKGIAHQVPELVYLQTEAPAYTLKKGKDTYFLSLKRLKVQVDVSDGRVSFLSADGKEIMEEEGSQIQPSTVQEEKRMFPHRLFILLLMNIFMDWGNFRTGI